jgi:elongation factor G
MSRDIPLERVRNLGIMAHIDAGKTTLSERILYYTGRIHQMGEVHHGNTRLDHHPLEQKKGITIMSAATTAHWAPTRGLYEGVNHRLQLIDTPGHFDFTVEVERSLRVLDGAVAVFDAAHGVEPQSETVWRQADRYGVPRLAFINKMDKVGADFERSVESLVTRLHAPVLVVQLPYGEGGDHRGVIDLVHRRAYVFDERSDGRRYVAVEVPSELKDAVELRREHLVERCAELDPTLTDRYLESGASSITTDEIERAIRRATLALEAVPVLCGSAFKNKGVQMLLDAVVKYLPSPADLRPVQGTDARTGEAVERPGRDDAPVCALAFKLVNDRNAGALTFLRVYSGTLRAGMAVVNATRDRRERVGRLVRMHADEQEEVTEAPAGSIVAAIGLRETRTGDTLCDPRSPVVLQSITVPEPVVTLAVETRDAANSERLATGLARLCLEDPSLAVATDEETGQTLLKGVGELHLEIVLDRLRTEYKVEARAGKPRVAWRETLGGSATVTWRHSVQSGGPGQFAVVVVEVAPGERDTGLVFSDETRGGVIPREFVQSVERGIRAAMERGIRNGRPVVDVRVKLIDGATHPVDSNAVAFEIAGSRAFQEAARQAGMVLLEPVMAVEVTTPDEFLGESLASVQSRRGHVRGITAQRGAQVIEAEVPLASLFGYVGDLRSRTQGRAGATLRFARYEPVPARLEGELLADE